MFPFVYALLSDKETETYATFFNTEDLYEKKLKFVLQIHLLVALAFVPPADVKNAFDELIIIQKLTMQIRMKVKTMPLMS